QNTAFGTVVPGKHPQTIRPLIEDDVVHMTYRTARKGVRNVPGGPTVGRGVDVDFVASRIIEVFTPEDMVVRRSGNVQRPRTAEHAMRKLKLFLLRSQSDNRSR